MTPFRCELTGCPVTFKTSTHRKTHIATIHGTNKQNGKFSCTKCTAPNWYLGESQLKHHINTYHQDSPRIEPTDTVSAIPSSSWCDRLKNSTLKDTESENDSTVEHDPTTDTVQSTNDA